MKDNKRNVGSLLSSTISRPNPKRGEIYQHFKGRYYIIEDIAYDTERMAESVVYRALYGECKLFVRDLKMFMETLSGGITRFTKVDSLPSTTKEPEKDKNKHTCPYCGHENEYDMDKFDELANKINQKFHTNTTFLPSIYCERCGGLFPIGTEQILRGK